jgi:predicted Zn-dependent protease
MCTEMEGSTAQDRAKRYTDAVSALNNGDWRQAQHLSMHLLREVPANANVYFVAGVAALELLQMPLAVQCLQHAVELDPTRPDFIAQLAKALAQAGEPGKALDAAD